MTWAYPEPVTLLRNEFGSSQDEYGNDLLTPVQVVVEGCVVRPSDANAAGSNEDVSARDLVISGYTLLAPPGTVIEPTDQVLLTDGFTYEVVGRPGEWRSPFTNHGPGVQVTLRRVTG